MALPKNRRIKREKDFEKVFSRGRAFKHPFFLLKFLKNDLSYCRAAVSVPISLSKKAVVRNRTKRIFWAALDKVFIRCLPAGEAGYSGIDLVIIVSPAAAEKNLTQITRSLEDIFIKANIVNK